MYDDYTEENNVYLPAEWLADEGIDQGDLLCPSNRKSAAKVVERTASHAETFLDDAQAYIEAMPLTHGNTIAAWSVPYLLSVGTIRELNARPEDALTESGVKISRREVLAVVEAAVPPAVTRLLKSVQLSHKNRTTKLSSELPSPTPSRLTLFAP